MFIWVYSQLIGIFSMRYAFKENRQDRESYLSLFTMMDINIDDRIRSNLRRIIDSFGIQQNKLAEQAGVHPSVINDILGARRPMGKDTMARICRALKIDVSEFYKTDSEVREEAAVYREREAEKYGVADQVKIVTEAIIEAAKKKSGSSGANAAGRPERTRKRAI